MSSCAQLRSLLSLPVVSVLVAILGALIPIALFLLTEHSKELSFGVVARSPLVALSAPPLPELTVSIRGEKVERVESLTVKFNNSGTAAIEARDFERPMVVSVKRGSKILSTSVSEAVPETISPAISQEEGRLLVEPLLLNPGDKFSVTLVVTGDPGLPELNARISGIGRVRDLDTASSSDLTRVLLLGGAGFVGSLTYFYLAGSVMWVWFARPVVMPAIDGFVLTLASGISAAVLFGQAYILRKPGFWTAFAIFVGLLVMVWVPVFFIAIRRARSLASPGGNDA